ncbi:DUF3575 domain-containing protein [Niabella drilacis]|uniref:DUF3575 domain-containing protein n=1 Tax=Niabella drilacis (strain DSM 25811 / CCM 8410 / CCUG 62505 / LMG 26954 / E90) TaxID=1285928 RepID=A0A1G7ABN0_NIADE|nr:DUF3575 domain-containing protein [Niabella drilacis]SDE12209.1 Protein of unknown function [Niabella drilacis]
MMKINCCILLLLSCIYCVAQEEKLPDIGVKLNLTTAASVVDFPTLQLGVEKYIGNHLSLFAEAGYQLYALWARDTAFVKEKGLRTNMELRKYLKEKSRGRKFYVGGALFYRGNTANDWTYNGLTSQTESRKDRKTDAFWSKKRTFGCNAIMGFDFLFKKWLQMELYVGIGIKKTATKDFELQANQITNKGNEDVIGAMLAQDNMRNGWGPNATLGVRIGRFF